MYNDFFSEGRYIDFPFIDARVSLFSKNVNLFRIAIKIYQPFSKKAKIFKKSFLLLVRIFPWVLKLFSVKYKKGAFINYIESKLDKEILSSIYYPTITDKLVLQLMTKKGNVLGYVKIGLNQKGNRKILQEKQAIKLLSDDTNFLENDYLVECGIFKKHEFIIIKELEGSSRLLSEIEISSILVSLIRDETFLLRNHPKFLNLQNRTTIFKQFEFHNIIKNISEKSKGRYNLAYEHGDFAPWNIIEHSDGSIKLLDFEYFSENGIQYLDEFNYYYQIGRLLEKLEIMKLIAYLKSKIKIEEFYLIFGLFLINKIADKIEECSNYNFEMEVLKAINKEIAN